jgi:predicted ester cyclase
VAEGDKVATRIIGLGKAAGELLGVSGNGRPITVTANVLTHFDNAGLIVEEWVEADAYGLLKQLGAL